MVKLNEDQKKTEDGFRKYSTRNSKTAILSETLHRNIRNQCLVVIRISNGCRPGLINFISPKLLAIELNIKSIEVQKQKMRKEEVKNMTSKKLITNLSNFLLKRGKTDGQRRREQYDPAT